MHEAKPVVPGGKLVPFLYRHGLKLSWIGCVIGIVWIFLFPRITISTGELKCRGTYFSENALLPRVARPKIGHTEEGQAIHYHQLYLQQPQLPPHGCQQNCSTAIVFLLEQLRHLNLEVYQHEFFTPQTQERRTNIYAILRAGPGADGKEAMVLVTHYSNIGTEFKASVSGLGIGIAIMEYLSTVKWLAKDVILLLADDGPDDAMNGYGYGVQAWLNAYHADPFDNSGTLPMHAGLIRGAITLDIQNSGIQNSVAILGAGINGQLPNLDLINTAVHTLKVDNIPIAMDRCETSSFKCDGLLRKLKKQLDSMVSTKLEQKYRYQASQYLKDLFGMFRFMQTLVTGPSGNHAAFINFNIDSISLYAARKKGSPSTNRFQIAALLRSLESLLHAISNLEEKFHQSFYFYLLPNTKNFVSIGEYYYSLALILLPIFYQLMTLMSLTSDLRVAYTVLSTILALTCGGWLLRLSEMIISTPPYAMLLLLDEWSKSLFDLSTLSEEEKFFFWWLLFGLVVEILLVQIILFLLRPIHLLSGTTNQAEWVLREARRQIEEENAKAQRRGIRLDTPEQIDLQVKWQTLTPDEGWKGLKITAMLLVLFSTCIIGILNYPFALCCGFLTVLYSTIVPLKRASLLGKLFSLIVMVGLMPSFLLLLLQYLNGTVLSGLLDLTLGYANMGIFTLPYLCCIYFPIHALCLCVLFF